jgi:hypothetical protein
MDKAQQEQHNRTELRAFAQKYGVEALERVRAMMLERAESFPDRDRDVVWIIEVDASGEITLDVRP